MKCPLCHEELIELLGDYICHNRAAFYVDMHGYDNRIDNSLPHFEYRQRDHGITKYYVPPYQIINEGNKSEIWIIDNSNSKFFPVFNFITKTNEIHPDDPAKLLERIRKLIIFS